MELLLKCLYPKYLMIPKLSKPRSFPPKLNSLTWTTHTDSVVVVACLVSGSKKSGSHTGFSVTSGKRWKGILNSHYTYDNVLELHTSLSIFLAWIIGSKPGMSEGVFRYDKASLAFMMVGSASPWLLQSFMWPQHWICGVQRMPLYI